MHEGLPVNVTINHRETDVTVIMKSVVYRKPGKINHRETDVTVIMKSVVYRKPEKLTADYRYQTEIIAAYC
jgi:hypothetical protein